MTAILERPARPAPAPTPTPTPVVSPEAATDHDLVALVVRAQHGDERAVDAVVRRCNPMVVAVARRYLANPADVEDVVQDVWLAFVGQVGDLSDPACVRGWLCRVAKNAALRSRERAQRSERMPVEAPSTAVDATETPAVRRATEAALQAAVAQAIDRLAPADARFARLLMCDEAVDYRTLSRLLDRPVGSLGPVRQRLLARLRRDPAIAAFDEAARVGRIRATN